MYKNILVAVDGSPTSKLALHEALRLAKDGAQVRAVNVVENPLAGYMTLTMVYSFEVMHGAFLKVSQDILKEAEKDAENLGQIKLQTGLIDLGATADFDIASALVKAATDFQADLIVIGTHGRRGIKRLFLGSVAENVISKSLVPVLLIRDAEPAH